MAKKKTSKPVIAVIHLGCAKNQVDSERILGMIAEAGYVPSGNVQVADAVVLTTCAFIKAAVEETSDLIESLSEVREAGGPRLVVAGCMVNRLGQEELHRRFPAVDGFIDLGSYDQIPQILKQLLTRKKPAPIGKSCGIQDEFENRARLLSTQGYAYLKISEGCSNRCNYCTIPVIRGPIRSRPMEEIIKEAEGLADLGAAEMVLVAQDTAVYRDPETGTDVAELIKRLSEISGIQWIRLMYAHPAHITDSLVSAFSTMPKLVPYLDMPIQHASDKVLKLMKRGYAGAELREIVQRLKSARPGMALRTTVMLGHPGEDREAFEELIRFMEEARFLNVGAFVFTPEEGTVSAGMELPCSEEEAQGRLDEFMSIQQKITFELLDGWVGKIVEVVVENSDTARTQFQAPEVDGIVYTDYKWEGDSIQKALLTRREGYDLKGEPV